MKVQLRTLALLSAGIFSFTACENKAQTEALVQAKLDAEKVKELSAELETAKAKGAELTKENEDLKAQLTAAKAVATVVKAQPSTAQRTGADHQATEKAEVKKEALKQEVTGGSSFK